MADYLSYRLRYEVVPIVRRFKGGDLLCESLVDQFGWLRNEKSRCRRDRSFGLRQNIRVIHAR